ncbi:MAG: glycosyltransferase family 4 protein [Candidatus Sumerlaeia bacterium]|nr:glycosyltransferase family 4 protein [Candidatus Sumerlaeia bacterium]
MCGDETLTVCSPELGIDPESNLGGAVYDRGILRALAALGTRILIPLPRGERCENVVNWQVIETPRHRWKYYEYNLIFRRTVARLLADRPPIHILRAHAVASVGPGLLGLARRHGIPCHLHYHHWERHFIRNLIERWTLHRYDLVTTDSEFSRRDLIARYGLRNRIVVNYPGVREGYAPGPASRDLAARFGRKQVLLYVGVLAPRKNLSFLLGVVRRLRAENHPDAVLAIVGSGPEEPALRRKAESLGIANAVVFAGRTSETVKMDYYRVCDVFVFPSLMEGFGMAPAEAMAFGKPVVAANTSSLPEVVADGETGFLAPPTDEADFAAKIARLLDSPELRNAMGCAGRRRVAERFDFRRTAEILLNEYLRLKHRTAHDG